MGIWVYSKLLNLYTHFFTKKKGNNILTIEEYAKSNYKFLNRLQAMLFISHGVPMKGAYVSYDKKTDTHNLVYVFEKNEQNKELLNKFKSYELDWGDNVIEFDFSPTLIEK